MIHTEMKDVSSAVRAVAEAGARAAGARAAGARAAGARAAAARDAAARAAAALAGVGCSYQADRVSLPFLPQGDLSPSARQDTSPIQTPVSARARLQDTLTLRDIATLTLKLAYLRQTLINAHFELWK